MPGSITSFSRLLNELLDTRREARWVEKGNRNASFPLPPFGKGGLQRVNSEGQVMIAASPEISRYGIVFAAAHVFNSLDDHHETKSSRQFLPTENPEGPLRKGGWGGF